MNLIEKVRSGIAAALQGKTPEQLAEDEARANLTKAAERFLVNHPEYVERYLSKPTTAPAVEPVRDTKQKMKRIKKSLGADSRPRVSHTADHIDPEVLERARAKCREIIAANPERYASPFYKKEV